MVGGHVVRLFKRFAFSARHGAMITPKAPRNARILRYLMLTVSAASLLKMQGVKTSESRKLTIQAKVAKGVYLAMASPTCVYLVSDLTLSQSRLEPPTTIHSHSDSPSLPAITIWKTSKCKAAWRRTRHMLVQGRVPGMGLARCLHSTSDRLPSMPWAEGRIKLTTRPTMYLPGRFRR